MQKLAEICVKRPVFATMLVLSLTVVGLFSFFSLGVDRFPNVDIPVITVVTTNPGASPAEIEREISDRIEGTVNTVSGITDLRSVSVEGLSQVVVEFELDKNVDVAAQEVRQKIDLILNDLPDTAKAPVVQKLSTDAAAVLMYAVSSPRPLVDLTELADTQIVERIQSVTGVGNVTIYGGRKRQIRVVLDPERLRAYNLTVAEVGNALRAQNVELPGGSVDQGSRTLNVRTMGKLPTVEEFNDLVIASRNDYAVKIRDVGFAESRGKDPKSIAYQNGASAVVISVQKQSGTNAVAVVDAVKERVEEIQQILPGDMKMSLVRDQSEFIEASLHAIEEHLILGGFFAAIVVLAFMRNWRSTIIAAIAIPTSIISAFAVMQALGYTLNMMTMLALTLMVGVVIDDAIVVLENIFRYVEEKGMDPYEASIEATKEIGLAVMATTLSLLAVFVPIGFMGGIVGRFMSSFGLTAAAAIAVSLIVSFTLTPMLAARWIRKEDTGANEHGSSKTVGFYRHIDALYMRMLHWSMANRWKVVGICALVILSLIPIMMVIGAGFLPEDDENEFEVSIRLPEGTSLLAAQTTMERISQQLRSELPGIQSTLTIGGFNSQEQPNNGSIFVRLTPASEREFDQSILIGKAREMLSKYPEEVRTSVQAVDAIAGGERNSVIQFVIAGPDLDKLDEYSGKLLAHMKQDPNMVDVDRSMVPGKPEVQLQILRERAANLGVRVQDIALTVNSLFAGETVSTYSEGKRQYDVVVRAPADIRRNTDALLSLTVPSATGTPVEMRNLVALKESTGPGSIDRLNRERQVTLYANVPPNGSQTAAISSIRQFMEGMQMDAGYRQVVTGTSKELEKTGYYFLLAVSLSFIFMYMVLAAQFESFIHPVTILLTLPLAIPFALFSSVVTGQTLNIFSALGILLLFGVVKKNAILQIDHTNGLRAKGYERMDAILEANRDRLRPILMTTLALVAGMMPLVLGSGPGAATNRSIGVLVVGGQSLCLLLTLLAVPVFYSLFEDAAQHRMWKAIARRANAVSTKARSLVPSFGRGNGALPGEAE